MAVPKRRNSPQRRDKRRTHWKLSETSVSECKNCHQPKLPHRACPNCGYYDGRSVFIPQN
ncbi:MAG: 50S ribosomal protein L32 [Calditrichaeota bacterium]|nr:MAG: 50S ribosomal protein L32 [Calditrichota bacterium]